MLTTTKRRPIELTDSGMDLAMKMSERNPGGLAVCLKMMEVDPLLLLIADDMNIRGSQLWVGYKDHCGEDINKFLECLRNRDAAMIETINRYPLDGELAVTSGASFTR